jgi:LysM repeat protein/sulfur carrier protein ThiS
MLKNWIAGAVALLCINASTSAQDNYDTRAKRYIAQFRELAVAEQKRSGVPAAITLAQGIHETAAGNSPLAVEANNHFGIKCKKSWQGETYTHTDDAPDECFRKYPSPEDSYKDHSDYLSQTPRYAALFKLSPTDYAAWAIGLKRAGYATNPKYAQVLIRLVEEYHLQEYTYAALDMLDKPAGEVIPEKDFTPIDEEPWAKKHSESNIKVAALPAAVAATPSFPPYGQAVKVNGLKAVYAKKGDMPLEYAINQNIRYEKLLEINEIPDRPLSEDMYLYLERRRFKGTQPSHVVRAGETIAGIARFEGMQSRSLRELNHLKDGDEPAEGVVLYLQEEAPKKPVLVASARKPVEAPLVEPPPVDAVAKEDITPPPPPPPGAGVGVVTVEGVSTDIIDPQVQFADQKVAVNEEVVATTTPEAPASAGAKEIGPEPVPEAPKMEVAVATASITATGAMLPVPPPDLPKEAPAEQDNGAIAPPVNIANEKPVEEELKAAKAASNEPKDEVDALKAKFDKVVYAPKPVAKTPVAEPVVTPTEPVVEAPKSEPPAAVSTTPQYYTVKKGDTAFNIAKRNNITVRELMDWNKLDFEGIKIGQKLRVK